MHPQLKHARFNLIIFVIAFVPTVCTYLVLLWYFGPRLASTAFSFFSVLALWALARRFYRVKPGGLTVVMDERDQSIRDYADLQGWRVVWLYWCLICFVPWFWVAFTGGIEAIRTTGIPVEFFPLFYGGAFIVHQVTWSLVIVFSYREAVES